MGSGSGSCKKHRRMGVGARQGESDRDMDRGKCTFAGEFANISDEGLRHRASFLLLQSKAALGTDQHGPSYFLSIFRNDVTTNSALTVSNS